MPASTQNVMRQSATCRMSAPATGASTGPTTNITCTTDSRASRRSGTTASFTTAVDTALTAPAPKACRMRVAMSMTMSTDSAHKALASAYVRMPASSTGLRP